LILRRTRFFGTAIFVFLAAFVLGLGNLLTEGPSPRGPVRTTPEVPAEPQKSGDDGGFSILLVQPGQPYLLGRQPIRIEPTLPSGDRIQQVDFFVDGRLLLTDRQPPYATEFDFGEELKRHTIIVRALTAGGRRANVSFLSRSGDVADRAAGPIVVVPAEVRDPDGRPVEGLSVSDFTLLENGVRQPIVHFESAPAPVSIAVAVQSLSRDTAARSALLRGAVAFVESLPAYDSLGLFDAVSDPSGKAVGVLRPVPVTGGTTGSAAAPSPGAAATRPAAAFSYDHRRFLERLGEAGSGTTPPHASLPEALVAAGAALRARPVGRVVLAIVAIDPEPLGPPAPPGLPGATGAPPGHRGGLDAETAPPLTLETALEEMRKAGATLYVVVLGNPEAAPARALRKAAEEAGGDFQIAAADGELADACRRSSDLLLHRYLISYAPANIDRKGWRALEVHVSRADLEVRARKGTYTE
jgi:hypothetical protein